MNAVTPMIAETGLQLHHAYDAAVEQANAWRGQCIDLFAKGDAAAIDCLLRIAADVTRGGHVKVEPMVGQRLRTLAAAIGPGGPFSAEGKSAVDKLEDFRALAGLRNILCHGTGKVRVGRNGGWTLILTNVEIKGGKPLLDQRIFHEADAGATVENLLRSVSRLGAALGNIPNR